MTTKASESFILFLGGADSESTNSRAKVSGIPYKRKVLDSSRKNWQSINELLALPGLSCALVKVSARSCEKLTSKEYENEAKLMLQLLGKARHAVFVHESVLSGEVDNGPVVNRYTSYEDDDDEIAFFIQQEVERWFRPPSPEVRHQILEMFDQNSLDILPYRTNAELSTMALSYIEEIGKRLLFRIYIPRDRIWAAEAGKLLDLFRDWLTRIRGREIRQDGYSTAGGDVYEFFGTDDLVADGISAELNDFSSFLDLCIDAPDEAVQLLTGSTLMPEELGKVVDRFAREARRIRRDIRHETEDRLLRIKHKLENELEEFDIDLNEALLYAEKAIPKGGVIAAIEGKSDGGSPSGLPPININQQIIGTVNGIVGKELYGGVNLGDSAKLLLDAISKHGGENSFMLESAVHELEDENARHSDRVTARQRLKLFLIRVGEKLGDVSLNTLQKYVEAKIGVSG